LTAKLWKPWRWRKGGPTIYVNNKAKSEVDIVDRNKREVVGRWPVTKCKGNVAMALDEVHHRLFVACSDGQLLVLDTQTGMEDRTVGP